MKEIAAKSKPSVASGKYDCVIFLKGENMTVSYFAGMDYDSVIFWQGEI